MPQLLVTAVTSTANLCRIRTQPFAHPPMRVRSIIEVRPIRQARARWERPAATVTCLRQSQHMEDVPLCAPAVSVCEATMIRWAARVDYIVGRIESGGGGKDVRSVRTCADPKCGRTLVVSAGGSTRGDGRFYLTNSAN